MDWELIMAVVLVCALVGILTWRVARGIAYPTEPKPPSDTDGRPRDG